MPSKDISKIIFVVALIVFSFTTFQIFANHNTITKSFPAGNNQMISFRDIDNLDPVVRSVSADVNPGVELSITVIDADADIDTGTMDVVFASATSATSGAAIATTTLTETGVNTGEFNGIITLSSSGPTSGSVLEAKFNDQYSIFYEPHPLDSLATTTEDQEEILNLARAKATVDLSTGGDITITDVTSGFDPEQFEINNGIRPILYPIEISFSNGAAQTPGTDMEVTISYANANLQGQPGPNTLKMYYKMPGFGWAVVRDNFNSLGHNPVAKTITSVPSQAGFIPDVSEGQFLLGYDVGFAGGGGGGLVRAGLVVNILAGASSLGTGGGSGPPGPTITLGAVAKSNSASETISMPDEIRDIVNNHDPHTPLEPIVDIYEDFDLPFSINGNGFALGDYENTLVTQTIQPGEPTEFKIVFYTNSEIAHTSLYFNLGPTKTISGSDTQVLLYKDRPVEIIDSNGNIASASGTINNEGELKRVVTASITFSEDTQISTSDLIIRAWNDNLNSGDTIVYNAIQIAPSVDEIAFEENIPEPEVEQLKSQYIPIWIKNNANWWSQELIEDKDFVAGLEYLIQNNIVTIPDSETTINEITTQKIPSWIKNTAGWWSENQITEKEFIDGIQWLISNGIIKVVET